MRIIEVLFRKVNCKIKAFKLKPKKKTMKTIAFLLLLVTLLAVKAKGNKRAKRGLAIYEFGKMINCATVRSWYDYNGYGCWCGRGGNGTVVDATDRCCYDHDQCYSSLVSADTCGSSAWFWTRYKRSGCTDCSTDNSGCGEELCHCDQKAARCFANAHFDTNNEDYDRNTC